MHIELCRLRLIRHLEYEEDSYQRMQAVGRKDPAFLTKGGPQMVLSAYDLLFPQYDEAVEKLKHYSREWLQETVRRLLEEDTEDVPPEVVDRWRSIANGDFFK